MSRKDEIDSRSQKIVQMPTVTMPDLEEDFNPSKQVIEAREKEFQKDQYERLKFAEEPVTIRFEPQGGDFAPTVVDCWVNGKGAEMWQDGRWVEYGAFPIGYEVITKRKYVEVLARSKRTQYKTQIVDPNGERPENKLIPYTSATTPFTIIDFGPNESLGKEWAKRMLSHA